MLGITKKRYEKGIRCRGLCYICEDVQKCYQTQVNGFQIIDGKVVNTQDNI